MIKSLILTALLTSGVGANATPLLNKEAETEQTQIVERNNANIYAYADNTTSAAPVDAAVEWTQTNVGWESKQRISWIKSYSTPTKFHEAYSNKKYEMAESTNPTSAALIKAYAYRNDYYCRWDENGTQEATGWLFNVYPNMPSQQNTEAIAIQYTPYQNINSNNINIEIRTFPSWQYYINAEAYNNIPNNINYVCFNTKLTFNVLQSTNNWTSIIDTTMTQNNQSNYETYQNLTNPQNAYTYNKITKYDEFETARVQRTSLGINGNVWIENEDYQEIQRNVTITIPIDGQKTNYVYIYRTIQMYITDENGNDISQYLDTPQNGSAYILGCVDQRQWDTGYTSTADDLNWDSISRYWNLTRGRQMTFSGTYLPPVSMEVIDIPSIMFNILSMPFTFVSTAFNLTLFPGTPYQINIGSIVLMLFGLLVFIFLFKIILKVFK